MSAAGAFGTRLAEVGLDLVGALPIAEFDALVPARWQTAEIHPTAAQWIVIASGGRALFAAFEASEFAGDGARDPLDRFVRAHVADACSDLEGARAFHYDEARRGEFADFVALGRACGLGSHGALGLSMHPEFGPWWSIRALVGVERPVGIPSRPAIASPCMGCAAPCVAACRGGAVLGPEGDFEFDSGACAATRLREPGCADRCDARRACPLGADRAYSRAAEAHHLRASLAWIRAELAARGQVRST